MRTPRRGARLAILAAAAIAAVAATVLTAVAVDAAGGRSPAGSSPSATANPRAGDAGRIQAPVAEPSAAPAGVPVRVDIAAIGASAQLETLRTDSTGKLIPPARAADAGWFAAGIVPGQIGPAIIAGHIDYSAGPGIFERLDQLRPGDTAVVTMSTGQALTFRVDGSQESAKAQFPTSAVYGITPDPQLRLITCAGTVDPSTKRYRDNLVVFLTLVR